MSWRAGSRLFAEIWPLIQSNIPDHEQRIAFTSRLLKLMVRDDMDPYDIEDIHPDIRTAMRRIGIAIGEPGQYKDDIAADNEGKKWWRLWR